MRPIKVFNDLLEPIDKLQKELKEEEEDEYSEPMEETIARAAVVKKYKKAARIANEALVKVIKKCVAKANVGDICEFGDKYIRDAAMKLVAAESSKDMDAGVAFPVCISVNNCICHFSPLRSDPPNILSFGDLVKIDLGVHVDGYISVVAFTLIVGATKDKPATGRKADVVMAAYMAAEGAMRVMKPGKDNYDVTDVISKTTVEYRCRPVAGMVSHQLTRNNIEGYKTIILNPTDDQIREQPLQVLQMFEVYGLDVIVSTGEGKFKEMDARTTVFKRADDKVYNLKMKTSRQFYTEVEKKFFTMPFSLRAFNDEKKARLGVIECTKHDLIEDFKVLCEKPTELVAQFKFTVLLLPDETQKINRLPFDIECYKSDYKIDNKDVQKILALPTAKEDIVKEKEQQEQAAWDDLAEALQKM